VNQLQCKLGMNGRHWHQEVTGQRSRSQEAEVRFGGLVKSSFSIR